MSQENPPLVSDADLLDIESEPAGTEALGEGLGRLHGILATRLGTDILSGRFAPGEVLPSEVESSHALSISRSAYREAIRILAAKGMVESRPKAGTRVTERVRWNLLDPDVLRWMFAAEPDFNLVQGLFELRLIVEPAAAAFAAQRRDEADLEAMRTALDIMTAETLRTEAGRAADHAFHTALMRATGNEALASLSSTIGAAVAWSTRYKFAHNRLRRDPVPDHVAVYQAIKRGDSGDARWAMESLIRRALGDIPSQPEVSAG